MKHFGWLCSVAVCLLAALAVPAQEEGHGERHQGPPPGHRHGVHHDFSDVERWKRVFEDPERDAWQKPGEVVQLAGIEQGMTVADLGAGTGYFEPYLSRAVGDSGRVLALDAQPEMVEFLRSRAAEAGLENVEPRLVPYDDPELAPASVDRVLIVDTWHHVADREAYAAKLRRALKPGGAVVVVDFTLDSPKGPPAAHRLPPERVARELEAGGLAVEVLEEGLENQYVVVGSLEGEGESDEPPD